MSKRVGQRRQVKVDRFAALRSSRSAKAKRFAALERRERLESARLVAARRRLDAAARRMSCATLDRRRAEFNEIPARQPISMPVPRPVRWGAGAAFVLPLIIACLSNLIHVQGAGNAHAPVAVAHHRVVRTAMQPKHIQRQLRPTLAAIPKAPVAHQVARPQQAQVPQPVAVQQPAVAASPSMPLATAIPTIEPQHEIAIVPRPVVARPHKRTPALWALTADGTWTATIHAPTNAVATFEASTGQLIALERSAIDGDAATVTVGWSRPVDVTITSAAGTFSKHLPAPDDGPAAFAATAVPVGPHLVNVGWTVLRDDASVVNYEVFRETDGAEPQVVANLAPSKHSWHDVTVDPGASYRYDVVAQTDTGSIEANTLVVQTPATLPVAPATAIAGKGMFLYFSSLSNDQRYFRRYTPHTVIAEAIHAGIRVIELRMARGSCVMAQTAEAKAWLDELIDDAASHDIKLVAWTVPRRVTTQDLVQTIDAASYQTPSGNGFAGLALDLETGDHYMGNGPKATASLVQYIKMVRAAVGPHYLIVATVASPGMGNHTNADYPYARIARYADVLQPMEYWHYFDEAAHHEYGRGEVAGAAAQAVARTRALAGRDIPVNVAGQSVDLEGTGAPSGREISWSLGGAKSAGGIGETFFDWAGTRPDAWAAIQAFEW